MCGRYEQHIPALVSWMRVLGDWPRDIPSRYNVCPTQTAATVDAEGYRERHWSLIPAWSKAPKLKYSTFNARAESLADKATFRKPVIPGDVVHYRMTKQRKRGNIWRFHCEAMVDNAKVAEADIGAMLVSAESETE